MTTEPRPQKIKLQLTREQFDALLSWLAPDRDQAAHEYVRIRSTLIRFFSLKGCDDPAGQCDQTFDRVARKITSTEFKFEGEPYFYIKGVAKNVAREPKRKFKDLTDYEASPQNESEARFSEEDFRCLERCLDQLPLSSRRLVERYYMAEGKRTHLRRLLAIEVGSANALRLRVRRLCQKLAACIIKCKETSAGL